mgnify:CR=1 FL=1
MRDITEQDVKVFTDAVTDYFGALGDEPASIRTFYLACGEAKDVVGDLTGIITLSGDYRGAVYFAAPRALIRSVLQLQKTHSSPPMSTCLMPLAKSLTRWPETRAATLAASSRSPSRQPVWVAWRQEPGTCVTGSSSS